MKKRFAIVGLIVLLFGACGLVSRVQPVKVVGTAMMPALNDGDLVIIDRHADKFARGDIVIFLYPKNPVRSYLKRIVGLPNETVEIREGKVFINGQLYVEPYIDPRLDQSERSVAAIRLDFDSYFVMGITAITPATLACGDHCSESLSTVNTCASISRQERINKCED
jgi:signal peptidase I